MIKDAILNSIKKIIGIYRNRNISNLFNSDFNRIVLISYITHPFRKESFGHTNYFEAKAIARSFNALGYNVDVIFYNSSRIPNLEKYDVIFGFGDALQKRFDSNRCKAKVIFYGTGMQNCFQNYATLQRMKDVYERKGVWLNKSIRYVEFSWSHQTILADGIIALGNDVCKASYKKYYSGKVESVLGLYFKRFNPYEIIASRKQTSRKNYLWFGGPGLVHKGLDLVLDYFKKRRDLTLNVCGPLKDEPEFCELYKNELFDTPNIISHGFVKIDGNDFQEILRSCDFVISPSCSEGGSPSTLNAIGNGGLIPIITKETTISTGSEIWIESPTIESVAIAIDTTQSLTDDQIIQLRLANAEYVENNYNCKRYESDLMKALQNILEMDIE